MFYVLVEDQFDLLRLCNELAPGRWNARGGIKSLPYLGKLALVDGLKNLRALVSAYT
jgi:hypothetical protein